MVNSFRNDSGNMYSLLGCVIDGKDYESMNQLDIEYCNKAKELAAKEHCHVFYNLKKFCNNGYEYSQYFLVPINAVDAEKIPLMFNGKNTDYWIGISYYHGVQDISYQEKMKIRQTYWSSDDITGIEYENECIEELKRMGFIDIEATKVTGDQGIDIIAWKCGLKYGIQCKHYKGSVSNKAVQEASAGAKYYDCDIAVVMTNSIFTKSAEELAHKIDVKLWSSNNTYKEV